MLAFGGLHIEVLGEGDVMNTVLYVELVEDKFTDWCGDCEFLVCDFEPCIRSDDAMHALSKTPFKLVDPYPRCLRISTRSRTLGTSSRSVCSRLCLPFWKVEKISSRACTQQ